MKRIRCLAISIGVAAAFSLVAASVVSAAEAACNGGVCLPTLVPGKWVTITNSILGNSKHMSGAINPDNGRIYFTGGDHGGGPFTTIPNLQADYRQETYSLSLQEALLTPDVDLAGFRLEYGYCDATGNDIQPKHPDFVGWAWDSRRHVFWLSPGDMLNTSGCPGETNDTNDNANFLSNHLFTFDPVAKKWADKGPGLTTSNWQAYYDATNDELIQFYYDGGRGPTARIYDIQSQQWRIKTLATPQHPRGDFYIGDVGAYDQSRRLIYLMDKYTQNLFVFDIASETMNDVAPGPNPNNYTAQNQLVWDPAHQVIIFVYTVDSDNNLSETHTYAFHPASNSWEPLPNMDQTGGVFVSNGPNVMVYDPATQAVISFGVGTHNPPIAPNSSGFVFAFLYNGPVNTEPNNPIPSPPNTGPIKSVPSTLGATFLGNDQDRVGQMNQTTPNGVSDFHISVSGLRSTPVDVRITSDTGGIWETPFNGSNWIIGTQFNGSAGDFWFAPFASNSFHVTVTYADGTTDGADARSPASPASTLQASFVGRDRDLVGQENRTAGDGVSDFHISVAGLRSMPVDVRITSDTGGIWETPFNGLNWIIATQFSGSAGDFWFEPVTANRFHIKVTYSDGTTDETDAG